MTRDQLEALAPEHATRSGQTHRAKFLDGVEDYLFIGGDRMTQRQAAQRLGVTMRTICRYRALLRLAETGQLGAAA